MPKHKPNLASALAESGQSRHQQPVETQTESDVATGAPAHGQAPSRQGTRPITGHFPKNVRDQLKMLAIERDKTVQGLLAEALNDLFAKYSKAEIAPVPPREREN